ncbi:MAG: hypothetical protein ABII12_15840 [Planctomycetota bacterium]|nr:hypothetical protein [Planctomycetota bacterium]
MFFAIGRPAFAKMVLALGLCIVFASAETAEAQRGLRGGGKSRGQKGTTGPRDQGQADESDQPGVHKGQVYKFEVVVDENDADLVGILKVRPLAKGAKVLKLRVHNKEDVQITVAGHRFTAEMYPEILWKGLFCSADWSFEGEDDLSTPTDEEKKQRSRRRSQKQLRALTFDTLEVEGKIEEIDNDVVVLKARPKDGRQWPDIEARLARKQKQPSADEKPRPVAEKKIRLKMLDGMTGFEDAASHSLDLGDFEVDQQIEAKVVFAGTGKKQGMLVTLRSLTAEEREEDELQPGDKSGPRAGPRGRGRGQQPRGRGRGQRPTGGGGPSQCPAIVVSAVSQVSPAENSGSAE